MYTKKGTTDTKACLREEGKRRVTIKKLRMGQAQWLISIFSALWEAEAGRS